MKYNIVSLKKLNKKQKRDAMELVWDGFAYVFKLMTKHEILFEYLYQSLNEDHTFVCMKDEVIIGFLGIGTYKARAFCLERSKAVELFGTLKGNLIYYQLHANLGNSVVKQKDELYIDFITTRKGVRKQGVATSLLNYAMTLNNYRTCYLDVLSNNVNAKRLYQYLGFEVYKKKYYTRLALGKLGYAILMKKRLR